jgi:hypothetical protein
MQRKKDWQFWRVLIDSKFGAPVTFTANFNFDSKLQPQPQIPPSINLDFAFIPAHPQFLTAALDQYTLRICAVVPCQALK